MQKKSKTRDIRYAAHSDSQIYAYYSYLLATRYEEKIIQNNLNENILAFRSLGKSNIQFANDAFEIIKKTGRCSAICLDVSGFFDNLDHKILKTKWADILDEESLPLDHYKVFKSITKHSFVHRKDVYKVFGISPNNPKNNRYRICSPEEFRTKVRASGLIQRNEQLKGIPQGTPISALLSNIYMFEFDKKVKEVVSEQGGYYFRYCDDILIIINQNFKGDVEKFVSIEISNLKLEINSDKTETRDFYRYNGKQHCKGGKTLQYLGFTFDGQHKLIRSAALAKFSNRMKSGVRTTKKTVQRKQESLSSNFKGNFVRLRKKKIYERYSHLGKRNFLRYGYRAANIMGSKSIKRQLKPLWKRLNQEIIK